MPYTRKFFVSIAAGLVAITNLFGASYYIDPAAPDDTAAGTSAVTPWKRCPGMANFSGTYVHQSGDRFIFKGGSTFTAPLAITNSGAASNPDYYGVDETWYAGTSWTRPRFDGQNIQSAIISIRRAANIYLDGLEITDAGNLAGIDYQGCIVLYDVGPVTINDIYVHSWDFTGTDASAAGGIVCNPQHHLGNVTVQNSVVTNIDGNQSHGGIQTRCGACLANIDIVKNCELGYAAQGLSHGGLVFANNYVHHMGRSFFTGEPFTDTNGNRQYDTGEPFTDLNGNGQYDGEAHDNCVYWDSSPAYQLPGSYYGRVPLLAYGNFFYQNLTSTGALYAVPRTVAQENFYAFDNVFYATTAGLTGANQPRSPLDVDARIANPNHPPQIYFHNNTVNVPAPIGGPPVRCDGLSTVRVSVNNNHFSLINSTGSLVTGNAQFSAANNVVQTPAAFASSGYVLGNLAPIGPAPAPVNAGMTPASSNAPTINAGAVLTGSAVPNLNVDYLGTRRASTGSWDAGAYESMKPLSVVSRKQHGSSGVFNLNLPLTGPVGIECRRGQGQNFDQHQLVFAFAGAVAVSGVTVSGANSPVAGPPVIQGATVTVNLSHISNAQMITVKLLNVTNGVIANDVTVPMGVLLGDVGASRSVTGQDANQIRAKQGIAVSAKNCRFDLDADGAISGTDANLAKSKQGTSF